MESINGTHTKETTIPHVTRHDGMKTWLFAIVGLAIAFILIAGTVALFATA